MIKRPHLYLVAVLSLIFLLAATLPLFVPGGAAQSETKTLRCWRCQKSFEVPVSQRQGSCPHCGARFMLAPPTPLPPPSPLPGTEPESISWRDGPRYEGQRKAVKGTIVGTHFSSRSGVLYLNFDPDYRNNLSIKIDKNDLRKFPPGAESFYQGKTVIATGQIRKEREYLRLLVTDPADLRVVE